MQPPDLAEPLYRHIPSESPSPDTKGSSSQSNSPNPKLLNYRTWLRVMMPLILHGFITGFIVAFTIGYINNRDFYLERRPLVKLGDGTWAPWVHSSPIQTDITTILSTLIIVLRLVAAGWLIPMVWRCAFLLMEELGLRPTQLRSLISYGVIIAPPIGASGKQRPSFRLLIWTALLTSLPAQLAAPILTGSIRWVPSNPSTRRVSETALIMKRTRAYDTERLNQFTSNSTLPTSLSTLLNTATTRPFLAWGHDTSNTALKRFDFKIAPLDINNTVENITLPYFTVQDIEWVKDPPRTLGADQLHVLDAVCPKLNMTPNAPELEPGDSHCFTSILRHGSVALIPDSPWLSEQYQLPSTVAERRLMVYNAGLADTPLGAPRCRWAGRLRPNATAQLDNRYCFYFAWVTYSAGVGTCDNCRISSYGTVQNDTELALKEDYITLVALRVLPYVASAFTQSELFPAWEEADDFVVGVLTRSYAGAWMALTERVGGRAYIGYSVSPRTTRAEVDLIRVYIWLGLQSLVTVSGIIFLYIQSQASSPLIKDVTLAAFFLDISAIRENDAFIQFWGGAARRMEFEDDRLVLKRD